MSATTFFWGDNDIEVDPVVRFVWGTLILNGLNWAHRKLDVESQ